MADLYGSQDVTIRNDDGTNIADVTPTKELRVSEHVKLVGEDFDGTIVDTNFWTSTPTGTGSVAITSGELVLATGATANSAELLQSVRIGRYVGGCSNYYRAVIRLPAVTGTNVRRWGAFNTTDGLFFSHDGTTLSINTRIASSDTSVASGSFNGDSTTYSVGATVLTYEIRWTNSSVLFYIGTSLIHTVSQSLAMVSATLSLPVSSQIVNSGGNTNDNQLLVRTATINRIGKESNVPIYKNYTGNSVSTLKYGPGTIHRIANGGGNGTLQVYDNTTNSGTLIGTFILSNQQQYELGCPFFTGLTVKGNVSGTDVTIIYE